MNRVVSDVPLNISEILVLPHMPIPEVSYPRWLLNPTFMETPCRVLLEAFDRFEDVSILVEYTHQEMQVVRQQAVSNDSATLQFGRVVERINDERWPLSSYQVWR